MQQFSPGFIERSLISITDICLKCPAGWFDLQYCEMITTTGLVHIHHLIEIQEKKIKILLVMRPLILS